MPESKIKTPKGRSKLSFELEATMKNGMKLPVEVFIVYPEDQGLHAVNIVAQSMDSVKSALYQELLDRQDASLVSAMLTNRADEDDEL